ncbi:MAG: HD-GYP domain-containing protein [Planctomycetota bacterium]|jgi:HD-GYP domain-containing protein (c-di-GMP phosphodiesterase class II)
MSNTAEIQVAENTIRALVVAMMNGMLYFSKHQRVIQAVEEAVIVLNPYFEEREEFVLALKEELLIYDGKPLYDLSIFAHRLTRSLAEVNAHGMRFLSGVEAEELRVLLEILMKPDGISASEVNAKLRQQGISRVILEERSIEEETRYGMAGENEGVYELETQKISRDVYTGALAALQDIMVDIHRSNKVSFTRVNEMAESMARAIRSNRSSYVVLTATKDYDAYTFNHSVNVCIYAAGLSECLTTSPEELIEITQAALLHDLGKLLVDEQIIYKSGKLTEAEWEVMRQHPVLGAKILMESEWVSELAINVAFGHHINHDRSGYPDLIGDVRLDPVTELIKVIDVYEAMTAKRPYKIPMSPEKAAEQLLQGAGQEFNPICVDAFLRSFGVYPPGTLVNLDNGQQGMVVSNNSLDPFRPVVQLYESLDNTVPASGAYLDTAKKNTGGEYVCTIKESIYT